VDSRVRILFATDVHGSDPVWKKFIRGASFYKANVLILGGDITGKNVVPVITNNDGSYSAEFQGSRHHFSSKEELARFEEIVNRTGSYMYLTKAKELEELSNNKKRSDEIFTELIVAKLRRWIKYAEENATVPVYVNAGNDDEPAIDSILAGSNKVVQPEDKVVEIATNHEMISAGFSNLTPWRCPRDLTEEEIAKRLETKISKLANPNTAIFNFHCPPVDSGLDTCPKLDSSVYPPKPLVDGGGIVLYGAGSTAVRTAIEKYQPMLGLHGHIHESRNVARIGKTVCINPGSEYGEGILRAVLVNIDQKGYKSYQFVSG
jgi:Icc-related predicted phosphoesterase